MMLRTNQSICVALLGFALASATTVPVFATGDCLTSSYGAALLSPGHYYLPVYDPQRNVTVALVFTGETYEFINGEWVSKNAVLEQAVFEHHVNFAPAVAYRSAKGHTVVLTIAHGIWRWNGLDWQQESAAPAEFTTRFNTAITYDPYRDVLIIFGGHQPPGPSNPTDELWEYHFATKQWTLVNFVNGPSARQRATLVFDPDRNLAILFGGRSASTLLGDTWAYDPTTGQWTEYDFGDLPTPPARERSPMAYHTHLQAILLSGGNLSQNDFFTDFWMFDGERWFERFPGSQGGLRGLMTYDSVSNVTRQYVQHPNNQLNIHSSVGAPSITSQPANQVVMLGQPVQFSVEAESWLDGSPLAYQWRRNGQPIPGAKQPVYTIPVVSAAHAGAYDCVVTNADFGGLQCGIAVSISAILTVETGSTCAGDLSGDGTVGVADLLMLLGAWGPCP